MRKAIITAVLTVLLSIVPATTVSQAASSVKDNGIRTALKTHEHAQNLEFISEHANRYQ